MLPSETYRWTLNIIKGDYMETYYGLIDSQIQELRLPKSEVKNNHWEGYLVATTMNELIKLINEGNK